MNDEMKHSLHNNTSPDQMSAREQLRKLFAERPFDDELLLTNFGLFFRASALAKIFFLHEAYLRVKSVPGDIYVFGVWLGQDMVVFESLRAMLEPYNASRTLVGFDTFDGYAGMSEADAASAVISKDGYRTTAGYESYLEQLLAYHRRENVMGHAVKHTLVRGDVCQTARAYVDANPASSVALAFFDLALYEPTLQALNAIGDRLLPGSVVVLDEFNDRRYPGETKAFREWAKGRKYSIERSTILPDRTLVTFQ